MPTLSPDQVLNAYNQACPGPNYCNNRTPVTSNLKLEGWKKYEAIIAEQDVTLIPQLECGFTMGINPDCDIQIPVNNHASAYKEYQVIDKFVVKHYNDGSILGPYKVNPLPVDIKPSPLQVAESSSGKKRPVLDMSYPKGKSVNNAIPEKWNEISGFEGEFKLPTHDNICKAILSTKDPLMFITDLQAYYMQLPSDWNDTPLMAFIWRDAIFLHRRLPFGCRSSCLHAQRVTDAVCRVYCRLTGQHIDGYVDDFASIVARLISAHAYAFFHALLDELGLLRSIEKCQSPDLIRIFLGLVYNLADMVMTIPEDKLLRAVHMLETWLTKDTCTKTQVQSLLGHINHLSVVVHAGRPFTARIVDMLRESEFPVVVSADLKQDIQVWLDFLTSPQFTRSCIIKSQELVAHDETLKLAVHGQTCVICCDGVFGAYKLTTKSPHIPHHAMYAVAVWQAVEKHILEFAGKVIKVAVPSKKATLVINRAKTDMHYLRPMIRRMWMLQAWNDCIVKAVKVQTNNNSEMYSIFHDFIEVTLP